MCDGPEGDKGRRRSGEEADGGQGPEGLAGPAAIEVDPIKNRQNIQDMGAEEGVASKDAGSCHLQTIETGPRVGVDQDVGNNEMAGHIEEGGRHPHGRKISH